MQAFIYAADIYCDGCGTQIRDDLDKLGQAPANPTDESSYDSDQYPKGPYAGGGGESDCPQCCAGCGGFLENPLTPDGVEYVRDKLAANAGRQDVLGEWRAFYAAELEYAAGLAAQKAGVTWWNNPHESGSAAAYAWDNGHTIGRTS